MVEARFEACHVLAAFTVLGLVADRVEADRHAGDHPIEGELPGFVAAGRSRQSEVADEAVAGLLPGDGHADRVAAVVVLFQERYAGAAFGDGLVEHPWCEVLDERASVIRCVERGDNADEVVAVVAFAQLQGGDLEGAGD